MPFFKKKKRKKDKLYFHPVSLVYKIFLSFFDKDRRKPLTHHTIRKEETVDHFDVEFFMQFVRLTLLEFSVIFN